ncbi:MAG: ribosome biogenesis GTPase Der [Actinobacteria bacterium]|nr:ribosome biogenesis GTPase Der [Actinomycetota bacterium]
MKRKLPGVVIVGKPNAGKSTLINRICRTSEAIVHKEPMITRDRKYYKAEWTGVDFYILDTGGIDIRAENRLSEKIFRQSKKAIDESDLVIFMVDIKEPITAIDSEIADLLRKSNKDVILVGNKWDNPDGEYYIDDYLKLGFGYPITISAIHGLNITELLDEIIRKISEIYKFDEILEKENGFENGFEKGVQKTKKEMDIEKTVPSISILGQPNVGKSTLFNSIINEERVIVDEIEGTTRDNIDSVISVSSKNYRFIDTAGLKKDKLKEEDLEFYSKLRTLRIIEKSDICLVLIDSVKGITNQDQRIVQTCIDKGASVCVLLNKTDIVRQEEIKLLIHELDSKLEFAGFIPFLKISALKKTGINEIFVMIEQLLSERLKKITDKRLIELFKELEVKSSIYYRGKKFKIKFIKQIKVSPPGFLVFSNMDIRKKNNIKRYIEHSIRENFGFVGTPIFFKFKF